MHPSKADLTALAAIVVISSILAVLIMRVAVQSDLGLLLGSIVTAFVAELLVPWAVVRFLGAGATARQAATKAPSHA